MLSCLIFVENSSRIVLGDNAARALIGKNCEGVKCWNRTQGKIRQRRMGKLILRDSFDVRHRVCQLQTRYAAPLESSGSGFQGAQHYGRMAEEGVKVRSIPDQREMEKT